MANGTPILDWISALQSESHWPSRPAEHAIPLETICPARNETSPRTYTGTALCQQIQKGIDTGAYECGICYEAVNGRTEIWHCDICWGVYHYDCILGCASGLQLVAGETPMIGLGNEWKCPSCRDEYAGPPLQRCWCLSHEGTQTRAGLPFNSCGEKCLAEVECRHECEEICHPGPCGACQMCARGVPRPPKVRSSSELSFRETFVPLSRLVAAQIRHRNFDEMYPGRTAVNERFDMRAIEAGNAGPQVLPAGIFTLPMICSILSFCIAMFIYALISVVVEPYKHRAIAENNHTMRAMWVLVSLGAANNSILNGLSVWPFKVIISTYYRNLTTSRFAARWRVVGSQTGELAPFWEFMRGVCEMVLFLIMFVWVLGPFTSSIAAPLLARKAEFTGVCNNFDTQIILDTESKMRQNPSFRNLDGYNPAPPYTMAIVDRSTTDTDITTLELNYYDPSYRDLFEYHPLYDLSVPPFSPHTSFFNQTPPTRQTLYHDPFTNMTHVRSHTRLLDEPNPADVWHHITSRQRSDPDFGYMSFSDTSFDHVVVTERPGFFRILYNWTNGTWTSYVAGIIHNQGTFRQLGPHLVLPSMLLVIPNYARFAASCKMEPFLKVHRSPVMLPAEDADTGVAVPIPRAELGLLEAYVVRQLDELARQPYREDSTRSVVLRTAAFGEKQGELEMCARRRMTRFSDGQGMYGLGVDLPVLVGLLAAARVRGEKDGGRGNCKGAWL